MLKIKEKSSSSGASACRVLHSQGVFLPLFTFLIPPHIYIKKSVSGLLKLPGFVWSLNSTMPHVQYPSIIKDIKRTKVKEKWVDQTLSKRSTAENVLFNFTSTIKITFALGTIGERFVLLLTECFFINFFTPLFESIASAVNVWLLHKISISQEPLWSQVKHLTEELMGIHGWLLW